jgi:heme-degrading monooxygenase HmoA
VIARISSAIVPHSLFDKYSAYLHASAIPIYEIAEGLVSVSVFQRPVVGYVELLTFTVWQSEAALTRFLEDRPATNNERNDYGVIHTEPHVYELVASRQGARQIAEDLQAE